MSKVYVLLRNNKQSGPHTLEELLQLGLKPLDLIWVEGKSFGWLYPSEINALKAYVAATPETPVALPVEKKSQSHVAPQENNQAYMPPVSPTSGSTETAPMAKVYVSMPPDFNRRAENKKKTVESAYPEPVDTVKLKPEAPGKNMQPDVPQTPQSAKIEASVVTKFTSTIPEREEEYTSWIYDKKVNKTKRVTEVQRRWAGIAVAALLILAAGFGISQYYDNKKNAVTTEQVEIANADKPAPEPLITEPETSAPTPITENNIANDLIDSSAPTPSATIESIPVNMAAVQKPAKKNIKVNTSGGVQKKPLVDKKQEKEIIVKAPEVKSTVPPEEKTLAKKEPEVIVASPKKKKTLNQKVDAFFSKFTRKKEETPVSEGPLPPVSTNTSPVIVERKAVRRDDKSVPVAPAANTNTNLADFVEVTTNKTSDNWMLGVRGLKVSLHNTGSETVKTAEVELRYYTEQNEVLEKKIVNFSNIPAGKTVTLPAPDHRLADHADFRLVNVK